MPIHTGWHYMQRTLHQVQLAADTDALEIRKYVHNRDGMTTDRVVFRMGGWCSGNVVSTKQQWKPRTFR